jgi:hypothetical protein
LVLDNAANRGDRDHGSDSGGPHSGAGRRCLPLLKSGGRRGDRDPPAGTLRAAARRARRRARAPGSRTRSPGNP